MHAQHTGSRQCSREHLVTAYQRTGMRHGGFGAGRVPADLECDNGFDARRGTQAAHEAPGVINTFDVEENCPGCRIRDQEIQVIPEIQVGGNARGDDGRETNFIFLRPVQDRSTDRAGLRNEGQAARLRIIVAEGDVETPVRTNDAETVWPHQANTMTFNKLRYPVFESPPLGACLPKARRQDQHHLDAMLTALFHDTRNALRRCRHDREIDCLTDFFQRGIRFLPLYLIPFRIDREYAALEPGRQQISENHAADGVLLVAGTEKYDAFRLK